MIAKFILMLFVLLTQFHLSCIKWDKGYKPNNKQPIAVAGPDQVITLPTDSISLNGTASSDPDGTISEWLWTKISGPASFNIIKPADSITKVKALVVGIYQFELKVTDNSGLSAKDTIRVIVDSVLITNHPPVANAGPNQTISLPANSVTLDGSSSTDPDNNITSYSWTKISGPASFAIHNSSASNTSVKNLFVGVYQFELKITDNGGLFSKDTMIVTIGPACNNSNRPIINAQLIPVGTLSQARFGVSIASAGNKIVFAGGLMDVNGYSWRSSRVDIYDFVANTWSTAELCVGRYMIAAIGNGNKIFFGGGEWGDGTWPVDSVDIYDVTANTWTVAHLSSAGYDIAAAAAGNKVFFAGGDAGFNGTPGIDRTKQVDIYDLTTGIWTTAQLSEGRRDGLTAVTANNKVYFSGGVIWPGTNWRSSNKTDIYDNATGIWSSSVMSESKSYHAGIAVGDKIYWAGGLTGDSTYSYKSCLVEIKNINTGNSTTQHLFKPGTWTISDGQNAAVKDNKIIFLRHVEPGSSPDNFDIYDITTNTWSIGVLPVNLEYPSIFSVNNTIYIAGGSANGVLSTQVWKLEF